MKYLLLLSIIFAILKSRVAADCDACIQEKCFVKDLITEGSVSGNLEVYLNTNELYFQLRNGSRDYTKVLYNLDTNTPRLLNIADDVYVPEAAFIQETGELFLASTIGLRLYKDDTLQYLGLREFSINHIQYKNNLYFSRLMRGLCLLDNSDVLCYTALNNIAVDDFVIDKNNDIFYRSGARIFKFQHPNPIFLFTHRFAKLIVDVHGELYYSVFNQIWKYNYSTGGFDEIGLVTVANMFMLTFDKDNNLIYYDIKTIQRIYRLLPNEGTTCVIRNNNIVVSRTKN